MLSKTQGTPCHGSTSLACIGVGLEPSHGTLIRLLAGRAGVLTVIIAGRVIGAAPCSRVWRGGLHSLGRWGS